MHFITLVHTVVLCHGGGMLRFHGLYCMDTNHRCKYVSIYMYRKQFDLEIVP